MKLFEISFANNAKRFHVEIDGRIILRLSMQAAEVQDEIRYGNVKIGGRPLGADDIQIIRVFQRNGQYTYEVKIKGIVTADAETVPAELRLSEVTVSGMPVLVKQFNIQPTMSDSAEPWESPVA